MQNLKYIIAIVLIGLMAGVFIMPARHMPEYALVLIDDQNRTYLSPTCAKSGSQSFRVGRAAEARRLNYEPDKNCRAAGGFRQVGRSYTGQLLEAMGLLAPVPNRWNADGTWNW